MRLTRLEVLRYRGVAEAILDLGGTMNVLVGPNGTGKSSLVDAMLLLSEGIEGLEKAFDRRGGVGALVLHGAAPVRPALLAFEVEVPEEVRKAALATLPEFLGTRLGRRMRMELSISEAQVTERVSVEQVIAGWLLVHDEDNEEGSHHSSRHTTYRLGEALKTALAGREDPTKENLPPLPRPGSGSGGTRYLMNHGGGKEPEGVFLQGLKEQLRDAISALGPERRPEDRLPIQGKQFLAQDASNLVDIVHTLQSNHPDRFDRLQREFSALFPETGRLLTPILRVGKEWRKPADPREEVKTTIAMADRRWGEARVHFENFSSGERQALAILAAALSAPEGSVLVIEEPETHLHPTLVRRLLRFLREVSQERQVLLLTHSSAIAGEASLEALWLLEKGRDGSHATILSSEAQWGRVSESLGLLPSDHLEDNVLVFVEGPDDEEVYDLLYNRWKAQRSLGPGRVAFVATEGWTNLRFYANARILALRKARPTIFAILDGDVESKVKSSKMFAQVKATLQLPERHLCILKDGSVESILAHPMALTGFLPETFPALEGAESAVKSLRDKQNKKKVLARLLEGLDRGPRREDLARLAELVPLEALPTELVDLFERIAAAERGT